MAQRSDVVRDVLLVALAGGAGALDAIGYVRLHAFTANMTGNTVLLGLHLAAAQRGDAALSGAAIAAFAAGAFLGAALGWNADENDPWPAKTARAFAAEIVLLVGFAACWTVLPPFAQEHLVLLVLGSAAMGLQSGITHDLHGGGASTTYMSGTVARTLEYVVDSARFGFKGGLVLNGVTWLVYLCAVFGVGVLVARGANVGAAAWIVVVLVVLVAVVGRPLVTGARRKRRS